MKMRIPNFTIGILRINVSLTRQLSSSAGRRLNPQPGIDSNSNSTKAITYRSSLRRSCWLFQLKPFFAFELPTPERTERFETGDWKKACYLWFDRERDRKIDHLTRRHRLNSIVWRVKAIRPSIYMHNTQSSAVALLMDHERNNRFIFFYISLTQLMLQTPATY